ncbi:hypothetical protein [Arcicella lustrica]|uniref:DUF4282 domain-containing protein n=1 Tax=Arcicella lustrica TaxID=2984196 RepID=A0ABU5SJ54_9BACT|nr:hypothetical protein [Arcicella sp. DC25W]MEA5427327.1 hypothetical protein [Arcicella sp. DC25W]
MNYKGKIGLTKFVKYFFYVFKAINLIAILIIYAIYIIYITPESLGIISITILILMSGGAFLIIYIAEQLFLLIASYFEDSRK